MQQHHNHNFPPTFSEARLAQLLANFDHGTHSFDRAERETPEERRMSFGDSEFIARALSPSRSLIPVLPPHPAHRRPSFLSGLSLTRPGFGFSSTPSSGTSTPTSGSHPKDNLLASLAMTSADPTTTESEPVTRPKSTPIVSHMQQAKQDRAEPPTYLQRSQTAPQDVAGMGYSHGHDEKPRHFDPSKEPRLLGIL